jgi:hypothetical protein
MMSKNVDDWESCLNIKMKKKSSWPQMTDKIQDTNIIISAYLDLKYTVQSVVFDSLKAIEIQKIYQEIC